MGTHISFVRCVENERGGILFVKCWLFRVLRASVDAETEPRPLLRVVRPTRALPSCCFPQLDGDGQVDGRPDEDDAGRRQ